MCDEEPEVDRNSIVSAAAVREEEKRSERGASRRGQSVVTGG